MKVFRLQTSLEDGYEDNKKKIQVLFQGPRRKLLQIVLRDGATLDAHKADVPISIQCIAGSGVLKTGQESVDLAPGVLVTMERNVEHEVISLPAVSILVSRFEGDRNP